MAKKDTSTKSLTSGGKWQAVIDALDDLDVGEMTATEEGAKARCEVIRRITSFVADMAEENRTAIEESLEKTLDFVSKDYAAYYGEPMDKYQD